jgi:hypothetical protein
VQKLADVLNYIDPVELRNYLESDQAQSGPHSALAKDLTNKSHLETIAKNFIIEYHEIPENYPGKTTILRIASEVSGYAFSF